MLPEHILRVGSITKSFTAVIILKLVEEGNLSLDDPLSRWFPDFPNAESITIRQLLNHTSGIPEIIPKILMKSIIPSTFWQTQKLVEIASREKPLFIPGSAFSYSNTNYILLGLIAEKVTSKTAVELLHEIIIDPLSLKHTFFVPYKQTPAALVPGWDRDLSHFPGMLDIGVKNTSWATGAYTSGALISNASDLATFFEDLFNGYLLSPAMVKEMTTFIDAPNPGFSEQTGYGLGLMQLDIDGHELVGHAMAIVLALQTATQPQPSEGEKVDRLFKGDKARWRKPYDGLVAKIGKFGDGFSVDPTNTYISLLRQGKKFAIVQVTTDRLDIGIKLKGKDTTERFEAAGKWNAMVTHRVSIREPKQIDAEEMTWLKNAFEAANPEKAKVPAA
jgi:CubicO group peptidase (beta-lactamase class C family)